jgi:hypothetical protein
MALKITDNTANRPMLPGTGARGLDANPERNFGNAVARPFQAPDVPRGYAGPSNDYAGADMQAASKAAEQVTNSLVNTAQYFDNLQIAEEDTRGTVAIHKVRESEIALRKALAVEATEGNWSNEEYGQQYTERLAGVRDAIFTDANLTHKKVVAHYGKAWLTEQATFHNGFTERVLAPRAVSQTVKAANDITDSIVATVMADGSIEAAQRGIAELTTHFNKPDVVGTVGADKAAAALQGATRRLSTAVLGKKLDDLLDTDHGPMAALSGDPINDTAIKGDIKGQMRFAIQQLPMTADERQTVWQRAEQQIDQTAKSRVVDVTREINGAQSKLIADQKLAMQVTGNSLTEQLINGSLNRTRLQNQTNALLRDPRFVNDPAARADVESMRLRFLDNVRAQEKAAVAATAADGRNIAYTTDKEAETAFKKEFGTADFAAMKPEQLPAAFAALASPKYMVLPTSVRDRIGTMVMSHDRTESQRGLILYNQLAKDAPLLLDSLHKDVRAMVSRVNGGQSFVDARAAVISQAQITPEAVRAADAQGREWLKDQTQGTEHPLKKVVKVDNLPPAALAAYDREFTDAVRRGAPPAAASAYANARVGKSFGVSKLLSFDSKTSVATMAAPETVFGADAEVIRRDVLDAGKAYGISADTKWKLQPVPNGRDTRKGGTQAQTYLILKQNEDGSEAIVSDNGKPVLYSFSRTDNVDVRNDVEAKRVADITANYNRLMMAAVKSGTVRPPKVGAWLIKPGVKSLDEAKKVGGFSQELWDQAHNLTGN